MADQENCGRFTRAAKKRSALGNAGEHSPNKKRVVLGELPNLSNVVVSKNPILKTDPQKPEGRAKAKVKKVLLPISTQNNDVEGKVNMDAKWDDPQMCGPNVSDIFDLHNMEVAPKRRPLPDYIEKVQKDVSTNMRGILVDWLVEVTDQYKLVLDTLEYEEIGPPSVEYFCCITDNTYTKDEVVKMEADILKALKFGLGNPTIKTFLRSTRVAQEDYELPICS